jgi:phosphoheptose isomerase
MLDTENVESKFHSILNSKEWNDFIIALEEVENVYVIGNGGNWAVGTHGAADNFKMSKNKRFFSPDSACYITAAANDWGYDNVFINWLKIMNKNGDLLDGKSMIIGLSSSGNSGNIVSALKWGADNGIKTCFITGQKSKRVLPKITNEIVLDVGYYHSAEILTLWLFYEMVHVSGSKCPLIDPKKDTTASRKQWTGVREHSYPDEMINIGIDFDGVIHRCSKGFYDGTIYDDPIEGSREALESLSQKYNIVVYTAKAKPDRPLINGKTGQELVWEWLDKNNLSQYVSEVTAEKPRARVYIDDKGIRFTDWNSTLQMMEELGIVD